MIPVIMCGGSGSRLWPVSREAHPKPFIRLEDGQSLLQKAYLRGLQQGDVTEVLTVTNRDLLFKVRDELGAIAPDTLSQTYILEPFARNTAAAVAAAAIDIANRHGPDCLMLVLAADHLIGHEVRFKEAVATATALAREGRLVTFGIEPTSPETGYGYIEYEGHRVMRFIEKPDQQTAAAYVASGRYLWNAGIFCFSAGVLLAEMQQHCPDVLAATESAIRSAQRMSGSRYQHLECSAQDFEAIPNISFDYAVMERSSQVAVVPCDIAWSDIGSWGALGALTPADAQGNRVIGQAQLHDVHQCVIQSPDRLVGAVGVRDLIIIDTPDALLVADKNRSQDVKHVFSSLKAQNHEAYKLHTTVQRPWGQYTVVEAGKGFKIKRLLVRPGASLSLQKHAHRSEHWVVVSGCARVFNNEQEFTLMPNQSTYIEASHRHRLSNDGAEDLVIIEVQTGDYLGEDDIVRFHDHYGRA